MNLNEYKSNTRNFSTLIGYIKIAIEYDSFSDVVDDYKYIMSIILKWFRDYIVNKNFDNITHEESLKLYTLIDSIREQKLFDKKIGNESIISDEILIWYEVLIKTINDERHKVDEKR